MLTAVHALLLAGLILMPAAHVGADPQAPDTSGLQFLGFRAGAPLDELSLQLQSLGGGRLRCRRSRVDGRVSECRGLLPDKVQGTTIDVWVSAIDSMAGVITLSGVVAPDRIDFWRRALLEHYGAVGAKVQGSQSMLQWVRRGRMLRLTWRLEAGRKVASVSLVDGHVLDDWGRTQRVSRTR
ncbi:MAG TPA: hypothetical protein VGC48_06950 [Gemmatimonadales bacterium]|jgi:hypothetical protein